MAVSDLHDELDAYVVGEAFDHYDDGEHQPDDESPPVPEDADGANRLLRRVRADERLIEEAKAVAFAELERIQEWYDDRTAGLRSRIAFTERSLDQWMRSHNEATGKKTVKLPNGELRVRPGHTRLVCEDEAAAVADLIDTDRVEWVRFKQEVDRKAMGAHVFPGERLDHNPNGEVAPEGFEWRQAWAVSSIDTLYGLPWPSASPLPNVVILVPTRLTFGYTTTKEQSR